MTASLGDNPFKELKDAVNEIDGQEVPVDEILTPEFIQQHSEFEGFEEMVEESQWDVESEEDFKAIPDEEFDEYVAEVTDYDDWEDMYGTAAKQWMKREMDL